MPLPELPPAIEQARAKLRGITGNERLLRAEADAMRLYVDTPEGRARRDAFLEARARVHRTLLDHDAQPPLEADHVHRKPLPEITRETVRDPAVVAAIDALHRLLTGAEEFRLQLGYPPECPPDALPPFSPEKENPASLWSEKYARRKSVEKNYCCRGHDEIEELAVELYGQELGTRLCEAGRTYADASVYSNSLATAVGIGTNAVSATIDAVDGYVNHWGLKVSSAGLRVLGSVYTLGDALFWSAERAASLQTVAVSLQNFILSAGTRGKEAGGITALNPAVQTSTYGGEPVRRPETWEASLLVPSAVGEAPERRRRLERQRSVARAFAQVFEQNNQSSTRVERQRWNLAASIPSVQKAGEAGAGASLNERAVGRYLPVAGGISAITGLYQTYRYGDRHADNGALDLLERDKLLSLAYILSDQSDFDPRRQAPEKVTAHLKTLPKPVELRLNAMCDLLDYDINALLAVSAPGQAYEDRAKGQFDAIKRAMDSNDEQQVEAAIDGLGLDENLRECIKAIARDRVRVKTGRTDAIGSQVVRAMIEGSLRSLGLALEPLTKEQMQEAIELDLELAKCHGFLKDDYYKESRPQAWQKHGQAYAHYIAGGNSGTLTRAATQLGASGAAGAAAVTNRAAASYASYALAGIGGAVGVLGSLMGVQVAPQMMRFCGVKDDHRFNLKDAPIVPGSASGDGKIAQVRLFFMGEGGYTLPELPVSPPPTKLRNMGWARPLVRRGSTQLRNYESSDYVSTVSLKEPVAYDTTPITRAASQVAHGADTGSTDGRAAQVSATYLRRPPRYSNFEVSRAVPQEEQAIWRCLKSEYPPYRSKSDDGTVAEARRRGEPDLRFDWADSRIDQGNWSAWQCLNLQGISAERLGRALPRMNARLRELNQPELQPGGSMSPEQMLALVHEVNESAAPGEETFTLRLQHFDESGARHLPRPGNSPALVAKGEPKPIEVGVFLIAGAIRYAPPVPRVLPV